MAIYHFSVKTISRSAGRSAVACSAYRSGEKLNCERYGLEQDYTKKTGVEYKKIYAPENAKKELLDRQSLWNEVEKVESRKDSNLAREFEIAFPYEINAEQRQEMLDELCQKIVDRHNVVVDAVIHAPHTKGGSDERNYHAHIMFTGRQLDRKTGDFAKKRNRDFNKEKSSETVTQWRKDFADLVNQHLERINSDERVSHLSYKDLKYDLEPTIHEGAKVTELRRQGIETEISLANDAIRERNAEKQVIRGLEQEIIATERLVADLKQERIEQSPHHKFFRDTQQNLDVADSHLSAIPPIDKDRVKNSLEQIRQAFQKSQELAKQEQRQKDNKRSQLTEPEKRVLAHKIIQRFNYDVYQKSRKLAMNADQKQYDQIRHSLEIIQRERSNLEMQMQNMGKRPMLFGAKDWDAKHDHLKADWHRTIEREKELKGDIQKADPTKYRDQAIMEMSQENPKAKENFNKAMGYLEKQAERQEQGQSKEQSKQAERQARLDAAREIGEAEKANKAQLDKDREQRAEQQRQQRMR